MKLHVACVVFGFLSLVPLTVAQTPSQTASALPRLVRFGGTAKDLNGNPLTGVVGITLSLYSDQTGGAPLWLETQNVHPDKTGHYTVLLGASRSDGLPTELFTSGKAQWLGVQVQGLEEQPRVLLVSVPYAIKAHEAETLSGKPVSDFVLSNQLPEQVHEILGASLKGNSTGLDRGNSKSLAAASQGPTNFSGSTSDQIVGVTQSGSGNGLVATAPATSASIAAIRGTATDTTGRGIGVLGSSFSNKGGIGVVGTVGTLGTRGNGIGVEGEALNLGGIGVSGSGFVGVQGSSGLPSGSGVQGLFSGTSGGGVVGINHPSGSFPVPTGNFGVYAQEAGKTGQGLFGESFGTGFDSNGGSDGVHGIAHSTAGSGVAGANMAEGGLGLYAAGGGGSSDNGIGGDGVRAFGGSETGLNPTGGYGVRAFGGRGFAGGSGVQAQGGDGQANGGTGGIGANVGGGSSTNNGNGGDGLAAAGGNGDQSNNRNAGLGVLALGGSRGLHGDGIDAVAGSCCTSFAGYFKGNVVVTGQIFAGRKDFQIDHPLDPGNKYLSHASVESSEVMNIYTGNVTTNAHGDAVVEFPAWFETLNGDFRYQLTVIGQFAQAIVASKIASNGFRIKTDKPSVEVSWQVTGVRHDAYAKAHPLVVEQQKNDRERGYYIHPELYGAPEEKGIEWARRPEMMRRIKEIRTKQLADKETGAGLTR